MRVLITCGPTWIPIDDVRVLSNHSSGEMGHLIAQHFVAGGSQVTVLEGQVTHAWTDRSVKVIKYKFFDELEKILKIELKKRYDCIVHAAAVSDFKLMKALKGKVDSTTQLSLKLIPVPKLINSIKAMAPKVFLVGFKLEPDLKANRVAQETKGLFDAAHCDLVVANSFKGGYRGFIVSPQQKILTQTNIKRQLAGDLVKHISQVLSQPANRNFSYEIHRPCS